VVYLPRTQGISSTQIRQQRPCINIGIIGTGNIASRFITESKNVTSVKITAAYNPDYNENSLFCEKFQIPTTASDLTELYANCNAVYIASPHYTHYEYARSALNAGKHVLCETPFVFNKDEAEQLYDIAERKNLVLMVALKTAYAPAFGHLVSLLKSRVIGDIVEVNASVTTLTDEQSDKLDSTHYGGSMSENACFPLLPIFKIFGTDFHNIVFYSKNAAEAIVYTLRRHQVISVYQRADTTTSLILHVSAPASLEAYLKAICIFLPAKALMSMSPELAYVQSPVGGQFGML